jgi:protein Tex
MKLPGVVTNITAFGAFIDIGVHQDGLAHLSQLADRFIKDANEAVKVHQKVMATVLEVDVKRKRISLSLKKDPQGATRPKQERSQQQAPQAEQQPKPRQKPQMDMNALKQAFMKNRT